MKQLVNLLLLAALVISVSAAPSIATNSHYQAEAGQYRNTSQGGVEVRDYGNTPAGSNVTAAAIAAACGDTILISAGGGTATTATNPRDLVYSVQVLPS